MAEHDKACFKGTYHITEATNQDQKIVMIGDSEHDIAANKMKIRRQIFIKKKRKRGNLKLKENYEEKILANNYLSQANRFKVKSTANLKRDINPFKMKSNSSLVIQIRNKMTCTNSKLTHSVQKFFC